MVVHPDDKRSGFSSFPFTSLQGITHQINHLIISKVPWPGCRFASHRSEVDADSGQKGWHSSSLGQLQSPSLGRAAGNRLEADAEMACIWPEA